MQNKIVEPDDITIGRYLGFPECCIQNFISFEQNSTKITQDILDKHYTIAQKEIHKSELGFIPCQAHAERVKNGEIRLEDLFPNRHHDLPAFGKSIGIEEAKRLVIEIIERETNEKKNPYWWVS